ncbi:energy-coupling factor ABC transporter permease [Thermanaerothrix sp. 4228-RoL]|uniref:Energy-coupling factor ABC transporter permease n=2 Tax=Thermanaerothrix TaxID=1077886 RepID=A0ABU3NQC7_9CHLR|nr:energy-coupling factor ABC transporter permease [Thermanaerothrix sp. 4228-RoL]MDT8898041.1 energy-coupling factor ABC transporter permease [Thermanaerothrix sp. 4228-RoL]
MVPLILAMHIPDGFLAPPVLVGGWLLAGLVIAWALRALDGDAAAHRLPLIGVMAAAIFAAQMLNFPIAGGTSGHLLGAALATLVLGPWAAMLVMTTVVGVQALFFQDGGLLALGVNLLNMAVIGVWVAYAVQRLVNLALGRFRWGQSVSAFVAAWASIFFAALACGLELALSGASPAAVVIPAMGGIHALIGLVEGAITVGALAFLRAARPSLLQPAPLPPAERRGILVGGLLTTLLLVAAAPLASTAPDGLERVAEDLGFITRATEPAFHLLPDYTLPALGEGALSTIIAGLIGAALVLGVAWGVLSIRARRAGH